MDEMDCASRGPVLVTSHSSMLENLHRNTLSLLPWSLATKEALAPPLGHPYHQDSAIQGRRYRLFAEADGSCLRLRAWTLCQVLASRTQTDTPASLA